MNCTDHPDMVVNSHCDVCHKPFCPSCLQDDRGRYVCKSCFDPANQPGELISHNLDLSDEKKCARMEAADAFWQSPTGVSLWWAGNIVLVFLFILVGTLSFVEKRYTDVAISLFFLIFLFGTRFGKSRM